jgi:hypothetical protein
VECFDTRSNAGTSSGIIEAEDAGIDSQAESTQAKPSGWSKFAQCDQTILPKRARTAYDSEVSESWRNKSG